MEIGGSFYEDYLMTYCPRCSSEHEPEDLYCPQCGQRLSSYDSKEGPIGTQRTMELYGVQYRLGIVYFKKGDYGRALEVWERALRERPNDEELKNLIRDARNRQDKAGGKP